MMDDGIEWMIRRGGSATRRSKKKKRERGQDRKEKDALLCNKRKR